MELVNKMMGAGLIVGRSAQAAGGMLWDSLDTRERVILCYAAGLILLVAVSSRAQARERRERRLITTIMEARSHADADEG